MSERRIDPDTLKAILASDVDNPVVIAHFLKELATREDIKLSNGEIDAQLRDFVFASLERLRHSYAKLFLRFWDGRETAEKEFAGYLEEYVALLRDEPAPEGAPPWPWPVTTPPESNGGDTASFRNQYSGLWLCGYRTGKAEGLPDDERRLLLDFFFRNPLPAIVSRYHNDEYGEPGSEDRLRKMANVIAALCRNFKRIDSRRYRVAIGHYERDLAHLHASYYVKGSFPWPPID